MSDHLPVPILLSTIGGMLIIEKEMGNKMDNPKKQIFQFGVSRAEDERV